MMMKLALSLVALAACKGDPARPDAHADAFDPPWWTPRPGEYVNWEIQLAPPFNLSERPGEVRHGALERPREMYVIDLWAASPATTIDHGDGAPVVVPAGPLAGVIPALRARQPRPIVVCQVDTGAIHLTDPDAIKFPGYAPDPPDRPLPPAPGSVIGWSPEVTRSDERFLDLHEDARARWAPIMFKRFDHAKQIGCDAVAADRNDAVAYDQGIGHGFGPLAFSDHERWNLEVAREGHARELSVGVRNGITLATDTLATAYDWLLVDRCAEQDNCDPTRPYISADKAVFAVEYEVNELGAPNALTPLCDEIKRAQLDGLVKDTTLTSSVRRPCVNGVSGTAR